MRLFLLVITFLANTLFAHGTPAFTFHDTLTKNLFQRNLNCDNLRHLQFVNQDLEIFNTCTEFRDASMLKKYTAHNIDVALCTLYFYNLECLCHISENIELKNFVNNSVIDYTISHSTLNNVCSTFSPKIRCDFQESLVHLLHFLDKDCNVLCDDEEKVNSLCSLNALIMQTIIKISSSIKHNKPSYTSSDSKVSSGALEQQPKITDNVVNTTQALNLSLNKTKETIFIATDHETQLNTTKVNSKEDASLPKNVQTVEKSDPNGVISPILETPKLNDQPTSTNNGESIQSLKDDVTDNKDNTVNQQIENEVQNVENKGNTIKSPAINTSFEENKKTVAKEHSSDQTSPLSPNQPTQNVNPDKIQNNVEIFPEKIETSPLPVGILGVQDIPVTDDLKENEDKKAQEVETAELQENIEIDADQEYTNSQEVPIKTSEVKQTQNKGNVIEDNLSLLANVQTQNIDDGDSYFFSYFMMICVMFICAYVAYHNKQKILALVVEGRQGKRTTRARRPNSANYRKLDSNLEEAVTSSVNKNTTQIIY